MPTDPHTVGLAGAAQLIRIERRVQTLRKGQVIKETTEVAYLVTSFWGDEANPEQLLQWARVHWSIENGQHFRRSHPGRRPLHCARDDHRSQSLALSLPGHLPLRTQRAVKGGKKSLPDYERKILRAPSPLIRRFMPDSSA